MNTVELGTHLPALPLAPAVPLPQRRLRFGRAETKVVQVLLAQRERACQSISRASLCLPQDILLEQLGLPKDTPAAHRLAVRTLRQTIWRVNPKLATQNLIIASVHCLGEPHYALFVLQEVWVAS